MSKVITFSRVFPSTHPKKGQPTYFIEKFINSIGLSIVGIDAYQHFEQLNDGKDLDNFINSLSIGTEEKRHTIRNGNRWEVGDKFSPRVWSGQPYKSKQIIIAPDIEIKKIWDIEVHSTKNDEGERLFKVYAGGNLFTKKEQYATLAKNDGLSEVDLLDWFFSPKNPFKGQIICWDENVNY